jgi:hypothetical protein
MIRRLVALRLAAQSGYINRINVKMIKPLRKDVRGHRGGGAYLSILDNIVLCFCFCFCIVLCFFVFFRAA